MVAKNGLDGQKMTVNIRDLMDGYIMNLLTIQVVYHILVKQNIIICIHKVVNSEKTKITGILHDSQIHQTFDAKTDCAGGAVRE